MNISFNPKESMKKFHENKDLNKLANLCFNNNNQIFYDIIDLISLRDSNAVNSTLNLLEKDYEIKNLMDIFNEFQECFSNIYAKSDQNNLRGAFLELLSYKIFSSIYDYNSCSMDCNIIINNWISKKTVDIAMICEHNALACESKISQFFFTKEIFENLIEIKNQSNDFFTVLIVTLSNKSAIDEKIDEISNEFNNPDDLNKIHIITRNDLANFSFNS